MTADALIRLYYAHFNARRLKDAASLIADDAVLEQLLAGRQQPGPKGYLDFTNSWLGAFPDAAFAIENISSTDGVMFNVDLVSSGRHLGVLTVGGLTFRPHGVAAHLPLRELLQIRDGAITYSSLKFDVQDIIRQLAKVDSPALLCRLTRLRGLTDEFAAAQADQERSRELVQRIGLELDAARHLVRPYFK